MRAATQVPLWIDGAAVSGEGRRTFSAVDPATGAVVGEVWEAREADVDAAVAAARGALRGAWGRLPTAERLDRLRAVAAGIEARFEEFLVAEIADTGKPRGLASRVDVPRGAANFRVFADVFRSLGTDAFHTDTPDGRGALNYAVRKPVGVVGVICPWNLPLLLMTWKVAPALAAGNTVVVKPSEETPRTATLLGEVMRDAGIPAGVYNVVHGFGPGSTGEWLTRHPAVDAITFTGESATGRAIMAAASGSLKRLSFELGGKNAGIVFASCDLEEAVAGTLRSAFSNCGQVCLTTERLYVERAIFEPFVERLAAATGALRRGDPWAEGTTLGPLISAAHREKVEGYLALARQEGATEVVGGARPEAPGALSGGFWAAPTIWTGLADDARCVQEEVFGPVCHIAPFDAEEEAIARANASPYGLCGVVWTGELRQAHRVASALEAGVVWVNDWYLRDLRTPFGGVGQSGLGREGGAYSFEFYSELSNICIKM